MGIENIISKALSIGMLSTVLLAVPATAATPFDRHGNDGDRWGQRDRDDDDNFGDRWDDRDRRGVTSAYARGYRDGFRSGFRDGRQDAWESRRSDRRSLRKIDPRDAYDRGFAVAYERGYERGFDSLRRRY